MNASTPECEQAQILTPLGAIIPLEEKLRELKKTKPKKVILIAGPTGCGKTELSLILARMLNGEVISADSMQVYRGMDIGTAKVSKEIREEVPHHLIDIRHIQESFNIVDFYYEAKQCCESILARDKVPLVVGGSGFYFKALMYGPPQGPPSLPHVRVQIEEEMKRLGPENMYAKLKEKDPEYAATITPNDRQKMVRGFEILMLTGGKVSDLKWECKEPIPDFSFHSWFIHRPKEVLYPMIEARCEQMLEAGLLDEVRELDKQGLRMNSSASQAIGYRQCLEYLDGPQDDEAYQALVRQFKTASRQYAKRQFTWFRKEKLFRWLDVDLHDLETAAEIIMNEYLSTV